MKSSKFGIRSSEFKVRSLVSTPIPHALPSALRAGISLLEVLISIGIVAIGLVSVAALIPVGGIQAMRADIEQRKAETGLNAFRDFKTRGFCIVEPNANCHWRRVNGTTPYFPLNLTTPPTPPPDAPYLLPVAIDPLMVSLANASGNAAKVQTFPRDTSTATGTPPTMQRLTLDTCIPPLALADAIFRATDDVVVDPGTDARLPPTSVYHQDSSTPPNAVKRESNGLYSWLAILMPYCPDQASSAPVAGMAVTLSVAVFYRRSLPNYATTAAEFPATVREAMANVTSAGTSKTVDYNSIGGGDVQFQVTGTINSTNPNPLSYVKPGSWLMLCRQKLLAAGPPARYYAVFNWYRVVASDAIDESAAPPPNPGQNATLAGPDWDFGPTNDSNQNTYACLYDGIVAVYQRTINLEGPSVWSQ